MTIPLRIDLSENRVRLPLVAAIFAAIAVAGAIAWRGDRREAAAPIVYVCTETAEMFRAPPQSVPAVNPKTGRRTLVRGVYCPKCRKWYAAPPSDHRAGNPKTLTCHLHGVEMTFDGPQEGQEGDGS